MRCCSTRRAFYRLFSNSTHRLMLRAIFPFSVFIPCVTNCCVAFYCYRLGLGLKISSVGESFRFTSPSHGSYLFRTLLAFTVTSCETFVSIHCETSVGRARKTIFLLPLRFAIFFVYNKFFNDKRAPTHNFVLNSCYFHTISPNFHFYHVSAVAYAIQGDDNRTNCILISFFQWIICSTEINFAIWTGDWKKAKTYRTGTRNQITWVSARH